MDNELCSVPLSSAGAFQHCGATVFLCGPHPFHISCSAAPLFLPCSMTEEAAAHECHAQHACTWKELGLLIKKKKKSLLAKQVPTGKRRELRKKPERKSTEDKTECSATPTLSRKWLRLQAAVQSADVYDLTHITAMQPAASVSSHCFALAWFRSHLLDSGAHLTLCSLVISQGIDCTKY